MVETPQPVETCGGPVLTESSQVNTLVYKEPLNRQEAEGFQIRRANRSFVFIKILQTAESPY